MLRASHPRICPARRFDRPLERPECSADAIVPKPPRGDCDELAADTPDNKPGAIEWIKFAVEIKLPRR
jgi:hypothetical protein